MNLFETVKASVSVPDAAKMYKQQLYSARRLDGGYTDGAA
jgi:hypothetical protein